MKRAEILMKIIEEQKKVVESLQQSVNQYKTESDMDEESTHDPEDFSHQTEAKDMQLRFEKTIKAAEQNLRFLENEKEKLHDKIENGCLIETDKNFLFVGISVPVFKIGDKEVVSFSDEAPIFENIKGKKVGEEVKVRDRSFVIQSFS